MSTKAAAKKKVKIPNISATRTRRASRDMSVEDLGVVEHHHRMTPTQKKAYLQRRRQVVLHPDDWDFAKKQGWTEGVEYTMDYKAKRLKLGTTDGAGEEE